MLSGNKERHETRNIEGLKEKHQGRKDEINALKIKSLKLGKRAGNELF